MFFKRIKHKNFEYIPRYYNPEIDEDNKKKKKSLFSRNIPRVRRGKNMKLIYFLILFIIILYFYLAMG